MPSRQDPGDRLTQAGALEALFADFDRQLKPRGYLPMGGQSVDATLVAVPKQRNSDSVADLDRIEAMLSELKGKGGEKQEA